MDKTQNVDQLGELHSIDYFNSLIHEGRQMNTRMFGNKRQTKYMRGEDELIEGILLSRKYYDLKRGDFDKIWSEAHAYSDSLDTTILSLTVNREQYDSQYGHETVEKLLVDLDGMKIVVKHILEMTDKRDTVVYEEKAILDLMNVVDDLYQVRIFEDVYKAGLIGHHFLLDEEERIKTKIREEYEQMSTEKIKEQLEMIKRIKNDAERIEESFRLYPNEYIEKHGIPKIIELEKTVRETVSNIHLLYGIVEMIDDARHPVDWIRFGSDPNYGKGKP